MQARPTPMTLRARRARLATAHPDATVFVATGNVATRNGTRTYTFRADSDALYLAALSEAGALLVIPSGAEAILFLPERSEERAHWEGVLPTWDEVANRADISEVRPMRDLERSLDALTRHARSLAWSMGQHTILDTMLLDHSLGRRAGRFCPDLVDLRRWMAPLRARKDAHELAMLRAVGGATAEAHRTLIKHAAIGEKGAQLRASFDVALARHGVHACAFDGIFAIGEESTCLHPRPTTRGLAADELVLVDAGGEHPAGYAADMTRVWPASGRFTDAQREVHDLVCAAWDAAFAAARPSVTLQKIHEAARHVLSAGVASLGWSGEVDAWFTHRTSHGIGLDIHEPLARTQALESGNTFTIEPGLYVDRDDARVPERYRGLGVRIEDTVAITHDAAEVLTHGLGRDADVMETIRARS